MKRRRSLHLCAETLFAATTGHRSFLNADTCVYEMGGARRRNEHNGFVEPRSALGPDKQQRNTP
jgi:hypothetical protein